MSNWLGINVYGNPIRDSNVIELCGYLPNATPEMPVGSPQFQSAVDKHNGCFIRTMDKTVADATRNQELVDNAVLIGTFVLPVLVVLLFGRRILRGIDAMMVNSAAGAIKAKRSAGAYRDDVRKRISDKVDRKDGD